jgi:transcriptional regulator with XRE-family HTH domain
VAAKRRAVVRQDGHPTEIFVGARIRMRRSAMGMTRDDLAAALGVSSDAVAELEEGKERVGVARLLQLSQTLAVPVAWFFEGLGAEARTRHGGQLPPPEVVGAEATVASLRELLLFHFDELPDIEQRRLLVDIARSLSDQAARRSVDRSDQH